jgi:hypothetical protein
MKEELMDDDYNISYQDFVDGIKKETIRFEIIDKKSYMNLYYNPFVGFIMRTLFALIYAPVILIPVICILFHKWILMLGFLGYFFGYIVHNVSLKTRHPIANAGVAAIYFSIIAVILICFLDILSPSTFLFTCTIYQFFFQYLREQFYNESAKNILIRNADNYLFATQNNIVRTFRVY